MKIKVNWLCMFFYMNPNPEICFVYGEFRVFPQLNVLLKAH